MKPFAPFATVVRHLLNPKLLLLHKWTGTWVVGKRFWIVPKLAKRLVECLLVLEGARVGGQREEQRPRQDQERRRGDGEVTADDFVGQLVVLAAADAVDEQVAEDEAGEER